METKLPAYRIFAVLSSQKVLPWNYNELLQGWLYDKCFKTAIGTQAHNSSYKFFNFSIICLNPVTAHNGHSSNIKYWALRFSSVFQELLDRVEEQLHKENTIEFRDGTLNIINVVRESLSNNEVMEANSVLILDHKGKNSEKMLSPLETEDFSRLVAECFKNRWKAYYGTDTAPYFNFQFIERPDCKIVKYKGRRLAAYSGSVRIGGNELVRSFAQCIGLGSKPSCGFGMVV